MTTTDPNSTDPTGYPFPRPDPPQPAADEPVIPVEDDGEDSEKDFE